MTATAHWWDHAVGYEVYLRSFADGNGDGVGDFPGLLERLDHLAWLGVDIVWITPFYPSPNHDWGYDVADYAAVDPTYGTLEDFDAVIDRAHDLGLRILIDIVPNHTSIEHPWFREAVSSPDNPHRDYYLWADPAADGSPPNNWVGYFGGPAWTLDEASGQYYCHLFLPEQPDLNWRNPKVLDEFDRVLRFWLERGVDGFRIDVAQAMVKDSELRSNPQLAEWDPSADRWDQWRAFDHQHDVLQPETIDIFRRWNAIAAEYDAMLLGETYDLELLHRIDLLVSSGDALHVGFWFGAMHIDWDVEQIRKAIRVPVESIRAGLGWAQDSHDEHRSVTRFGGGEVGRRRSLALAVLLHGLPGVPFLYQGQELGLESGKIPVGSKLDPVGSANDPESGRDDTRTPMPWEPVEGFGFTTASTTWLPFGGRTAADTVAVQRGDEGSPLHEHRHLLSVRAELGEIADEPVVWIDDRDDIVAFRRGDIVFAAHVGDGDVRLDIEGDVLHRTNTGSGLVLGPDEAMIVRSSRA